MYHFWINHAWLLAEVWQWLEMELILKARSGPRKRDHEMWASVQLHTRNLPVWGLADICEAWITLCRLHRGNHYSYRWDLPLTRWKWKARKCLCSSAPTSPLLSWIGAEGCFHSCPCWWVLMKMFSYKSNPKSKWKHFWGHEEGNGNVGCCSNYAVEKVVSSTLKFASKVQPPQQKSTVVLSAACGSGSVRGIWAVGYEICISIHYEALDLVSSDSASCGPNTVQYSPLETSEEIALGLSWDSCTKSESCVLQVTGEH